MVSFSLLLDNRKGAWELLLSALMKRGGIPFLFFFFLIICAALPIIQALPWWMPLALFVFGYLADRGITALGVALWGAQKFSLFEQNQSTVPYVMRFGPIGVFLSDLTFDFLKTFTVLLSVVAASVTPFFIAGFARPQDFVAVPGVLIGTLWLVAGGLNNAFCILRDAMHGR